MNGRRLALLIGIDRYLGNIASLHGSVADVVDMRSLLEFDFGFEQDHILSVTNEEATVSGIVDAIQFHLSARAQPEDCVTIYFSGHGSYRWHPAAKQREGCLVAHDSRTPQAVDLMGERFAAALRSIPARNLAVILDCCFSGNLFFSRAVGGIRAVPPRVFESDDSDPSGRGVSFHIEGAPFVLLTASSPTELAWETVTPAGIHRGVFTNCLTRTARQAGPNTTYRELMESVSTRIATLSTVQHPQLEGPSSDQFLFGDRSFVPPPYLLAAPQNGGVRLDGGVVVGVTKGSRYAVYQPGARLDGQSEPDSVVEVVETELAESSARIIQGGPVKPASRAVETYHRYEDAKVRVALDGLKDLAALLQGPTHLELNLHPNQQEGNDIVVTAAQSADSPVGGRVFCVDLPLFGISRRLPAGVAAESALEWARDSVTHWARWINLLRISNDRSSLRVEMRIKGANAASYSACSNQKIPYEIENGSLSPVYIYVLAFGDDGSVDQIFPPHSGPRMLQQGEICPDVLKVVMPEDRVDEVDIVKLIATTEPCDMRVLSLGAARATGTASDRELNPLEQMMQQAAHGVRVVKRVVTGDWTTRQIVVRAARHG